jgi:AcrR family transcriptional regulator
MNAMNEATRPTQDERPATRRREATRARILEAATTTLLAGGLGALSLHRLAAELDFTTAALYRYFPSKDALLAEVVEGLLASIAVDLHAASAGAGLAPLSRLRAIVWRWVSLAEEDPHRFALVSQLFATPDRVFAEGSHALTAVDAMFQALAPVRSALADAEAAKLLEAGDAEARALILFAAVEGLLLLRKQAARAPGRFTPDALVGPALEALLRGWGAAPEPSSALGSPPPSLSSGDPR